MERQGVFTDRSAWPVAVVRFHDRPWTDEDVADFLADLQHSYDQDQKFVFIVDARIRNLMNAGQRQQLVDYMKEVRHLAEKNLVSMGLIIDSAVVRGCFTAVTWIYKPFWDLKIAATAEEATEHVVSKLSEEGVELNALQRLLLRSALSDADADAEAETPTEESREG